MTTSEHSLYKPLLYHFGSVFAILNGLCLLCAALLLGSDLKHLFYRAVSFRLEVWLFFISIGASLLFTLIRFLRNRKNAEAKPFRTRGFLGFLRRMLSMSAILLLLLSIVSFFYLDTYAATATEEITNIYLIGISLKLYLIILLFSVAFTLLSLIFRATLLHPLVKLLIHYIGTVLSATVLELTLGGGLPDAKAKLTAFLAATALYAVFSVGYLLVSRQTEKKTEEEAYTNLYHSD